jgi:hypothetical protein
MKVQLIKRKNNHNRLRDNTITGETTSAPEVGKPFYMISEPKDPNASLRMVNTSTVINVKTLMNGWEIHTKSQSIYAIIRL